jgi:hypothetical protein
MPFDVLQFFPYFELTDPVWTTIALEGEMN